VTDWFGDYNLNADAGLRATVYEGRFAEAKIELRYDSTLDSGARSEETKCTLPFRRRVGVLIARPRSMEDAR